MQATRLGFPRPLPCRVRSPVSLLPICTCEQADGRTDGRTDGRAYVVVISKFSRIDRFPVSIAMKAPL